MPIPRSTIATFSSGLLLLGLLGVAGCNRKPNSAPTAQVAASQQWGGGVGTVTRNNVKNEYPNAKVDNITACHGVVNDIKGDEHWAFVILTDFQGSCNQGTSASHNGTRSYEGILQSDDGRKVEWQGETADGKTGQIIINGSVYDLSKGLLFLASFENGKTRVQQLDHNLADVSPKTEFMETLLADDVVKQRFLGLTAESE
ncbi:MAG: hypothetical protein KDB03_18850 [Planctomycetales bacterium]|nr:hypothetical protein [Planctomycetales bacterium]